MVNTIENHLHLHEPQAGVRSVDIQNWTITACSKPIVTAQESDKLCTLLGFPLPEMTYGSNKLLLRHNVSGWQFQFDTVEALRCVRNGELGDGDGGVKVGYADAWIKSRYKL